MNVSVQIPDDLAPRIMAGGQDLSRESFELIAADGYRQDRITKPELRRVLGIETNYQLAGFPKAQDIWIEHRRTSYQTHKTFTLQGRLKPPPIGQFYQFSRRAWEGIITPEQNKELDLWLPQQIRDGPAKASTKDGLWVYDNSLPLAIYPRKSNTRIIAQQGTFTVPGTERLKLDRWIVESTSNHPNLMCRVLLEKMPREESLRQLTTLGIRRHTMYPDLHNYVAYLRSAYGW